MAELRIFIEYASVFLPCYYHLLNDGEQFLSEFFDIEFLYGGRDSGKSHHVAMQLVVDCLTQPYFKCLMIRKVLNTVRQSQFDMIKKILREWELESLFDINETRMEIIFKANGNGFYGRGLDDAGRIKSFTNPSHAWIEEGNQIDADDLVIILTSLRASQRVKTWFTFNPECEVTYTEFWLYQDWFSHSTALSWQWIKEIEVDETTFNKFPDRVIKKKGRYYINYHVRATHTTYKNNPYCPPERIALYESYRTSKNNAYWYQVYTLGLWGYKRTKGSFLKCFAEERHITSKGYEKLFPIHVVADNNVSPYVAVSIWQLFLDEKIARQVHELPCREPDNTASKAAARVIAYLERLNYEDVVFVYGDATAKKRSTEDDEGRSFFDKFIGKIRSAGYQVINRVKSSNPPVAISGSFVNECLEDNYNGITIEVYSENRISIEDYIMTKEAADGSVLKTSTKDKETGQSYQKHGHFTDDLRYYITTVFEADFIKFMQRSKKYFGI